MRPVILRSLGAGVCLLLLANCGSEVDRPHGSHLPRGSSVSLIRHAYGFDSINAGAAGVVIGIVVAYHDGDLGGEVVRFDATMGVPAINGTTSSTRCTVESGPHPCLETFTYAGIAVSDATWTREEATDVEWAHALAPGADIYVVEAASPALDDMVAAADFASAKSSVVAMSWGFPESSEVIKLDRAFSRPHVAFVAASGDHGHGVSYPASSPNVIAVGGTRLVVGKSGERELETGWWASSGGMSSIEARPAYQQALDRAGRGVPDVSFAAEPDSGYAVYSIQVAQGWGVEDGTSLAAIAWSALVALADQLRGSSMPSWYVLSVLYAASNNSRVDQPMFYDVTAGRNGACSTECTAEVGFDLVTGLGTPIVPALLDHLAHAQA